RIHIHTRVLVRPSLILVPRSISPSTQAGSRVHHALRGRQQGGRHPQQIHPTTLSRLHPSLPLHLLSPSPPRQRRRPPHTPRTHQTPPSRPNRDSTTPAHHQGPSTSSPLH